MHSVVNRNGGEYAYSEKILMELGQKHGIEVVCSQDPAVFEGDLDPYDAFAFYTTGKPISDEGKSNLLKAIKDGKGFVGFHSATDTFHSAGIDPYCAMIGAEFLTHASQQKATMKVVSPNFPGIAGLDDGFVMNEEWYAFQKFAPDLHVILVQETGAMHDQPYKRPPYPATWRIGTARAAFSTRRWATARTCGPTPSSNKWRWADLPGCCAMRKPT